MQYRAAIIACDEFPCDEKIIHHEGLRAARKYAEDTGWTLGMRDLCPKHKGESK